MSEIAGCIHHIELNVSNLEKTSEFWDWFLGLLGYTVGQTWPSGIEFHLGHSYIVLVQAKKEYLDVQFYRRRVGLHHIAFHAKSKEQIDQVKSQLVSKGSTIIKDWTQTQGKPYAIYFLDPDGIEIELVASVSK